METTDSTTSQASIEDEHNNMESVKKVIDPKYKQTQPHVTRRLVRGDGSKGEGYLEQPHSINGNPQERSGLGYTWASHHLRSPLSKCIPTNQDRTHEVIPQEPGPLLKPAKMSYTRIHDTKHSITDISVHEAKHAGQDVHLKSQGLQSRERTQACQDLARSFQDAPELQGPEACHVPYESKLTQRRSSNSSTSASSEEPRSEDYNTADEGRSSISLPWQNGITPASFPHNDNTVPNTLDITDNDVLPSVGASTIRLRNTPKERMNGRMEQLRNVQTDGPFEKLFVICCHCGHWHDLPSGLRQKS
ncbi:hypothetical protein AbraIFM66950_009814 [Aspergillus brasiliensis]|nr:hypothetical protein AbraIFM66950_009814 [Aspergillus brasiliensis]